MAKVCTKIGYVKLEETSPGIWNEIVTERFYYGDLKKDSRRLQSSEGTNDNIVIANDISVIADPYAYGNFHAIRYVEFMGAKWKVENAYVRRPRLHLTLGEVYNV